MNDTWAPVLGSSAADGAAGVNSTPQQLPSVCFPPPWATPAHSATSANSAASIRFILSGGERGPAKKGSRWGKGMAGAAGASKGAGGFSGLSGFVYIGLGCGFEAEGRSFWME